MKITPLEQKLLDQLSHVRVESTHGLAGQCKCTISGANNALMRLYRRGMVGIEYKGVRGTNGNPTVWYGKDAYDCKTKSSVNLELEKFRPSLRNTSGNIWEARISLPVVGYVTTEGVGWEDAKLRLWLISESLKLIGHHTKDPKDWSNDEWRSTLKSMSRITKTP